METKINIKAKKEIVLILFSVFFISLVCALGPIPPIPNHFIGDVVIDGQNAPVGTQISIYIDSTLESSVLTTIVGKYDLYVKTGINEDLIEFKIQDKLAGSTTRQGGETIYLNVSITTTTPPDDDSSESSDEDGGGGGGGNYVAPIQPITLNETDTISEGINKTKVQKEDNQTPGIGMTGAVIDFLGSGKGITIIMIIIILGIGTVLIKFKTLKWKRNY